MPIIIIIICFGAIFLTTAVFCGEGVSRREIFVRSVIAFSVCVLVVTEVLSIFKLIAFWPVFTAWALITAANLLYIYSHRQAAGDFLSGLKYRITSLHQQLQLTERLLLYAAALLLFLCLVQGMVYAPNNWDSMTYHLSRIVSWISNGSIEFFPTHIFYQLYQPPFAEYTVMNLNILAGSDCFASSVQWFYLVATLIAVVTLVKSLGMGRRCQLIALLLSATIPEVVLQASSTQNDVVVTFFIVAVYLFCLKAVQQLKFSHFLFLSLAIGLAFLTKAIAYLYLGPALVVFAVCIFVLLFRTGNYNCLWYGLISLMIIAGVCARQYNRNYQLTGSILGTPPDEMEGYVNTHMSPLLAVSALLKNAGLHIGITGTDAPAKLANKLIYKFQEISGTNINSPENNFAQAKFSAPLGVANQEDKAPNFFHLLLIVASFVVLIIYGFKKSNALSTRLLLSILTIQVLFFCIYLKWQIWNTRLHVPLFMIAVVIICLAGSVNVRFKKFLYACLPVILLYAFVLAIHNKTRPMLSFSKHSPFITMPAASQSRYQQYFANQPDMYPEFQKASAEIETMRYKNIGLVMAANDWQYPLFTTCYQRQLNPVHLFVKNISKNIKNNFNSVDCIVSTNTNKPFIDYNGRRFYNRSTANKYVFLYR